MKTPLTRAATKRKLLAGFSLVELIVSIGIITLLSTALIIQQDKFDSSIYLRNLAYEVALVVREAQTYATQGTNVGTCVDPVTGEEEFDCRYGVHFVRDATSGTPDFVLFRDINVNEGYDLGEELPGGAYTIDGRNEVVDLCSNAAAGSCTSILPTTLTVMFQRPSPNPIFDHGSNEAAIVLGSGGDTIKVLVLASGQISVGDIE